MNQAIRSEWVVAIGMFALVLGSLAADCLPILAADAKAGVIAAAHSGRLGTARGVARALVAEMVRQGADIDRHAALDPAALKFMHGAAAKLGWSARGTHRVLKVARTVADLGGAQHVAAEHIAEAIQYRRAFKA